jgi:lipoprotein-releasing system ATP-binding protein
MGESEIALDAVGVRKIYRSGDGSELEVLRGVDFAIRRGEAVAIVGASGAGKSTLLHLFGALDFPSGGEIRIEGVPLAGHSREELAGIRNRLVGFVFQFHHLLREFTAVENVAMPRLVGGGDRRAATDEARALLASVGLSHREGHRPGQLSGGEQQRVAVARALINNPAILLADEPSGNLDERTGRELHELLFRLRTEKGLAMVLVTHNLELAARADRILRLEEGGLVDGLGS